MARPVDADAAQTRRRILAAASRLFAGQGAGDVSVRRVAAEAGVSLATVHHYFGSKEQLYAACIEAMYVELESLRSELRQALPGAGSVTELLERATRVAFRFAWAHRGSIRLLMRTIVDTGAQDPARRAAVHLPFLAEAGQLLAAAFGRPEEAMRLSVQSVTHLVVRYAITDPAELALLVGREGAAEAEVIARVEAHLVEVTGRLFGPSDPVDPGGAEPREEGGLER